jgi:hypothetical protein
MGLKLKQRRAVSDFRHGNGTFRADLDAGLATEALVGFDRLSFAVHHLEDLGRACCYTFFIADTLIFVYYDLKHHTPP